VTDVDPFRAVRSILVAVDGDTASVNAVAASCDIARHTKAAVSLLYVIEVPRSLPLDADLGLEVEQAERSLAIAESVAAKHKVKLEGQIIQARQAGHAIVDEAVESGADAIALGLAFERPFGKFQLSEATEYVLEHAPCEVWLFRYAPVPPPVESAGETR